jgi:hypothetical protein
MYTVYGSDILFICVHFNDAVSSSHYVSANDNDGC